MMAWVLGLIVGLNHGETMTPAMAGEPLPLAGAYHVTVSAAPPAKACVVTGGVGTVPAHATWNSQVACAPPAPHALRLDGEVVGALGPVGLAATGQPPGLTVVAGFMVLPIPLPDGSVYDVHVTASPPGQNRQLAHAAGVLSGADVDDIAVTCRGQPFRLGGVVSGLAPGQHLVVASGADRLTVSSPTRQFPGARRVRPGAESAFLRRWDGSAWQEEHGSASGTGLGPSDTPMATLRIDSHKRAVVFHARGDAWVCSWR